MTLDLRTLLQVLIFAVGIHVVLSFLRTTRGTGLVRGLGVALIVVVGGLFVLAKQLQLAELDYILQGVIGFLVVILAIVFQPELRRGIVSLGENPLLRRLVKNEHKDVVEEVAAAVVAMAKRKQGALIAFERDVALDGFVRSGVRLDARVTQQLLDSLFQDGGALHDGAVVLRSGRIESAASILPLSDNEELGKTVGTRHRAALGLSEETDAITIAVSEETGLISICVGGEIQRRVPRGEVESVLRERLGGGEKSVEAADRSWLASSARALFGHLPHKLIALALATGLFWIAWRDVQRAETFELKVVAGVDLSRVPQPGELRLILPDDLVDVELLGPGDAVLSRVSVTVDASQSQLAQLTGGVGGVLAISSQWIETTVELEPGAADWGVGGRMPGLRVQWGDPARLRLVVRRYERGSARLDANELDLAPLGVSDGLELVPGSMAFDPPNIELVGPPEAVRAFVSDPSALPFVSPDLTGAEPPRFSRRLRLREADAAGVRLVGDIFVQGELAPRRRDLGTLEADVAVTFVSGAGNPLERYEPPSERVMLRIVSQGILPADNEMSDGESVVLRKQVLDFVRANARVSVDLDRLDEGHRGELQVSALDPAWRRAEARVFDGAREDPLARLWLEIDGDRHLVLTPRAPTPGDDEDPDE